MSSRSKGVSSEPTSKADSSSLNKTGPTINTQTVKQPEGGPNTSDCDPDSHGEGTREVIAEDKITGGSKPVKLFGRESIERVLDTFVDLYNSHFIVVMATTSISAGIGAVVGALVATFVPHFISIQDNRQPTTSTPSPIQPSQPAYDYTPDIRGLKDDLQQCQADHKQDGKLIADLSSTVQNLTSGLDLLRANLTSAQNETQHNYTRLAESVTFKDFVVEAQMYELKNVFLSKEWIFIIILMGVFEVVVIGVVWKMWQRLADTLRQSIRGRGRHSPVELAVSAPNGHAKFNDPGKIYGDKKVLEKVSKASLSNRICVISFHSETLKKHTDIVKAILTQNEATRRVTVVNYHIRQHDHILQLPPCKLYLVFVDFNERNVILEDPNKGLGDLRLTTVQAIDLMGADAILTYSRDKGSRTLTSGDLYNQDLSSIRQHPEMRRLESRQRMLSVFHNFTDDQANHIINVVKDVVK